METIKNVQKEKKVGRIKTTKKGMQKTSKKILTDND